MITYLEVTLLKNFHANPESANKDLNDPGKESARATKINDCCLFKWFDCIQRWRGMIEDSAAVSLVFHSCVLKTRMKMYEALAANA